MYGLKYKHIRIEDQQLIFEMDKMLKINLIQIFKVNKLKSIVMKKGEQIPLQLNNGRKL